MTVSSTSTLLGPVIAALVLTGPPAAEAALSHPATNAPSQSAGAAASATPETEPPGAAGVVRQSGADTGEREEVLDYWTTERMRAAQPLNSPATAQSDNPPTRHTTEEPSTGEAWDSGGAVTHTTGKVFLTIDGNDLTCTATVVSSENRDTVVTAGHCLKDGTRSWADNWTFVPGYDEGEEPYGRYVAREMFVPPEWSDQADDSFDLGMAVLHTTDGKHVQDRTGAQRIAFGGNSEQQTYAFGYPTTGAFDGRALNFCAGRPEADDRGTTSSGMTCAMTEGSSGGPWMTDFDPNTGKGTVTSVISFKYADDATTQYGVRLGDEASRLYDQASAL